MKLHKRAAEYWYCAILVMWLVPLLTAFRVNRELVPDEVFTLWFRKANTVVLLHSLWYSVFHIILKRKEDGKGYRRG